MDGASEWRSFSKSACRGVAGVSPPRCLACRGLERRGTADFVLKSASLTPLSVFLPQQRWKTRGIVCVPVIALLPTVRSFYWAAVPRAGISLGHQGVVLWKRINKNSPYGRHLRRYVSAIHPNAPNSRLRSESPYPDLVFRGNGGAYVSVPRGERRAQAKVSVGYTNAGSLDSASAARQMVRGETQFFTTYFARRISKVLSNLVSLLRRGSVFAYDVSTVTAANRFSEQKLVAASARWKRHRLNSRNSRLDLSASTVDNAGQALLFAQFTYEHMLPCKTRSGARNLRGTVVSATLSRVSRPLRSERAGTCAGPPQLELRVPKKKRSGCRW
jgi:hypothetical protein